MLDLTPNKIKETVPARCRDGRLLGIYDVIYSSTFARFESQIM